MTARCSINILNVQTRIDILKTSAGADVVGATKIFEKEKGEEEIVCRIQSFIVISAHHCARHRRGYELLTPLDFNEIAASRGSAESRMLDDCFSLDPPVVTWLHHREHQNIARDPLQQYFVPNMDLGILAMALLPKCSISFATKSVLLSTVVFVFLRSIGKRHESSVLVILWVR
jgi:hypothetical protein